MRLDRYLKLARIVKRRTVAQEMITAGAVRINGASARSSREVREGDLIEIAFQSRVLKVRIGPFSEKELKRGETTFEVLSEERVRGDVRPW